LQVQFILGGAVAHATGNRSNAFAHGRYSAIVEQAPVINQ
jgi:hypothetical protein